MLGSISWTDFLIAVFTLTAIYYLYVLGRYFSSELIGLISGNRRKVGSSPSMAPSLDQILADDDEFQAEQEFMKDPGDFDPVADEEFIQVAELIDRLKKLMEDLPDDKRIPQEISGTLHGLLSLYPAIKDSPLRASINELIVSEWDKYSAVLLTEEEVDLMWEKVS